MELFVYVEVDLFICVSDTDVISRGDWEVGTVSINITTLSQITSIQQTALGVAEEITICYYISWVTPSNTKDDRDFL